MVEEKEKHIMGLFTDWHEAGYHVMPLWPILVDGFCGCRKPACVSPGKHPRVSQWNALPRMTDSAIERMEGLGYFATGYGVRMAGQLLVVDVDARNGGLEAMEKLARLLPDVHTAIVSAGLCVATGSGGGSCHYYFSTPRKLGRMRQAVEGYEGIDFKTNGFVVGPESLHASGARYEVESGNIDRIHNASEALISLLEVVDTGVGWVDSTITAMDYQVVESVIKALPNNRATYHEWLEVGMALHHATAGQGLELWQWWSAHYPEKHDDGSCFQTWKGFGKSGQRPVTMASLIVKAKAHGWEAPVEPLAFPRSCDYTPVKVEAVGDLVALPLDIAGADLTSPPGLAGELCDWINSNSYRLRENLAVAASLMILSCAGGVTHVCDKPVNGNIVAFGVAESGSGKDNILSSVAEVLASIGLGRCVYGGIRSEQEMVLNAIDNQLGYYGIDEIGSFLSKVDSAKGKGGASYLQGVVATILSITTKGDKTFGLSGQLLKKVIEDLGSRLKALKAGEDDPDLDAGYSGYNGHMTISARLEGQRKAIGRRIAAIKDNAGIARPYVCVFGVDTPLIYKQVLTDDNVGKGFLGRALLFVENDDAPSRRKDRVKSELPKYLKAQLGQMAYGAIHHLDEGWIGVADQGNRAPIITAPDALIALDKIADFYDDLAKDFESTNSLTPLALRACEQVEKVSFLLSLGGGTRTIEHVRWAFALVQKDLATKMHMVIANRGDEGEATAIDNKILGYLDNKPVAEGRLAQRVGVGPGKKFARIAFVQAVARLEKEGRISTERRMAANNRKEVLYLKKT